MRPRFDKIRKTVNFMVNLIMRKQIFAKCFLIFLLIFLVSPCGALAKTEAGVLQAYVSGDVLTVFTEGRLRYDSLSCTISNQNCELLSSGKLSEGGIRIKTTVLIDLSASAPGFWGGIEDLLKKLIDGKPPNEEFKIVAFGEAPEVISEFTADRYDLANALEKIKPENGESKIYDAICDTLPNIAPQGNQPAFYRALVIAGGSGDSGSAMTKEELFLKLQAELYPVDIVVVEMGAKTAAENKDLAAIARVSGGRRYILAPDGEEPFLPEMLGAGDYFYCTAAVPFALLDGSVRQMDIGDGVNKMSLDLKFPVFAFAAPDEKIQGENIEIEADANPGGGNMYIAAGGALLAISSTMVFAGMTRGKKPKGFPNSGTDFTAGGVETEFFGEGGSQKGQYAIKLASMNNPGQSWAIPFEGELLIGRAENCRLRLGDKSVSREQCKITVEDAKLVVVHLGATNKTAVNGAAADKSAPLQAGDTIKFGRESLRVDYVRIPGNPVVLPPDSIQNAGKGKTALLF